MGEEALSEKEEKCQPMEAMIHINYKMESQNLNTANCFVQSPGRDVEENSAYMYIV